MPDETTLKIPAIDCQHCVDAIKRTLQAVPSAEVVDADTETKLVRVQFDKSAVSVDQIRTALDEIGFSPD
ncbi:MAG: heavy-metal-associated domain-containing protein [Chloroflexi bacterium]|nr:heavy-metal-associated domain-containing protein [Chloroflexota bacterium]MCI0856410.1 heavy-metal-associated domain-containing protein [Chloroflexota bacterium]